MDKQTKTMLVIALVIFALVIVGAVVIAAGRGGSSGPAGSTSEARAYAGTVHVTLDVTTVGDMMDDMAPLPAGTPPPGVTQAVSGGVGEDRVYTWTFPDGSALVFAFKTKGAEGSGQGLVLNYVDVQN